MLHMTGTEQQVGGTYRWHCRCGDQQDGFTDQNAARKAGDAHLATANSGKRLSIPQPSNEEFEQQDEGSPSMHDVMHDRRITPTGHATPRDLWPDSREADRDEYDR